MVATAAASRVRIAHDIAVLDLSGSIVLGDPCNLLRDTIRDLVDKGTRRILLNFAQVDYIDSSGIAALVNSFSYIRDHNGDIKLLHLRNNIHDLLQLTRLNTIFDTFDDEPAALASFPPQATP